MKHLFILSLFLLTVLTLSACKKNQLTTQNQISSSPSTQTDSISFQNPKKSAHFESNTPEHASVLAGVPINIVINFNFDLANPSEITINKDGKDYGAEQTIIDANKLSMRRNMDSRSPDGQYTVNYNACWPDGSCHDGSFQFAIDKSQASTFTDITGQKEVTINLKITAFVPQNIKISKGTKITWSNSDTTAHYVNTDSHPAHTYVLDMNSIALKQGDTYSYTFEQVGIYPYHCSAHSDTMTGQILAE